MYRKANKKSLKLYSSWKKRLPNYKCIRELYQVIPMYNGDPFSIPKLTLWRFTFNSHEVLERCIKWTHKTVVAIFGFLRIDKCVYWSSIPVSAILFENHISVFLKSTTYSNKSTRSNTVSWLPINNYLNKVLHLHIQHNLHTMVNIYYIVLYIIIHKLK